MKGKEIERDKQRQRAVDNGTGKEGGREGGRGKHNCSLGCTCGEQGKGEGNRIGATVVWIGVKRKKRPVREIKRDARKNRAMVHGTQGVVWFGHCLLYRGGVGIRPIIPPSLCFLSTLHSRHLLPTYCTSTI